MRKFLIFCLALCVLSQTTTTENSSRKRGGKRREKLLKCIVLASKASNDLKNYARFQLNTEDKKPLRFSSMNLGEQDREVIKRCREEANTIVSGFKRNLYKCITENKESSQDLIAYTKEQIKDFDSNTHLKFTSTKLTVNDRKIVQQCVDAARAKK